MNNKLMTIPKKVLLDFINNKNTKNDLAIIHKIVNHNSNVLDV